MAVRPKRGALARRRGCTVLATIANRRRYPALIPARHHGAASDSRFRIAVLAPISWRTPPRHYGPWEQFASLLADGLVAAGHDVTLFATADSLTTASLHATASGGWSDDPAIEPKVAECLHIASVFERAAEFDIIHNGFDFLPLTYSDLVDTPVITTIHGFSSERIVPVYERYDSTTHYVAISDADRHPRLHYAATIAPRHPDRRVRRRSGARRSSPVLRAHPPRQGNRPRHHRRPTHRAATRHRRHHPGRGLLPHRGRSSSRRRHPLPGSDRSDGTHRRPQPALTPCST